MCICLWFTKPFESVACAECKLSYVIFCMYSRVYVQQLLCTTSRRDRIHALQYTNHKIKNYGQKFLSVQFWKFYLSFCLARVNKNSLISWNRNLVFPYGHAKWSVFMGSSILIENFEEKVNILELIEMTSDKDEECFLALVKNVHI